MLKVRYEHKYKNTNKTQFNGNACYALRCAVLHSGNLELEAVLIRKFRLSIHDHSGSIAVDKFDDETIDLNVISLIDNLVEGAEKSYILSSDKTYYNKFTYSIVDYTDALKIV